MTWTISVITPFNSVSLIMHSPHQFMLLCNNALQYHVTNVHMDWKITTNKANIYPILNKISNNSQVSLRQAHSVILCFRAQIFYISWEPIGTNSPFSASPLAASTLGSQWEARTRLPVPNSL